ncbi:hypothetical protein BLNAU_16338 [Blattamonas nauphoetae]|uniref:Secreted protein n=1 Tax=Blattamonas nauphoetae TaxID=2049346 RepID=A0ABQ9XEQ3_9EUKA|nr:hypothetical protein BLNAU_16338 [Blattamonas nauphoetae]
MHNTALPVLVVASKSIAWKAVGSGGHSGQLDGCDFCCSKIAQGRFTSSLRWLNTRDVADGGTESEFVPLSFSVLRAELCAVSRCTWGYQSKKRTLCWWACRSSEISCGSSFRLRKSCHPDSHQQHQVEHIICAST